MTDIRSQHIANIKAFASEMTTANWADMADRISQQDDELSRLAVLPLPAPRAAAAVCHDEQLEIWADEFVEHLLAAGGANCLPDFETYGDKITYFSALKDAIKDLVGKAFDHPELTKAPARSLPDEIAGLLERTRNPPIGRDDDNEWFRFNDTETLLNDLVAALQRLAQEVERLKELTNYPSEVQKAMHRFDATTKMRERLEAERDAYKKAAFQAQEMAKELAARIAELDADVEARIAENNQLHESVGAVRAEYLQRYMNATTRITELEEIETAQRKNFLAERDAIKAKTREECVQELERWGEHQAVACIRALNQPEAGGGE